MYMNEYNALMYVLDTRLLVDKRKVHARNVRLHNKTDDADSLHSKLI